MSVVIADGLTALRRAPESSSRRPRSSTVFIGRLRGGLGALSLLRRRRLALHLFFGHPAKTLRRLQLHDSSRWSADAH